MFFFGALVMRYRRYELFLVVPFVIVFVGWFFKLAFKNDSFVREPERLWREEPAFAGYSIFMFVIFVILAFIKTPFLWKAVENMRIGPPLP
jgi:hypothetical protein